jgi:ubiquinone/menaquinone biosynthesis C-methylase UbiE
MAGIGSHFTRRLLADAGISSGMRILDVGCGSGDVALMAAGFVGPGGSVLGIDRETGPLGLAQDRADELQLTNVTFMRGDMARPPSDLGPFDAIVGRRVLMYQPDAIEALRALARVLRPGGMIVLHEHDTTMVPASLAPMPLHHKVQGWMRQTIEREGADIHMGFNLHRVLTQAGLTVEEVRAEAIVQTSTSPYPVGAIIRAMLPRIVKQGVSTEEEIDIETLDQRLEDERMRTDATYIGDMMFGAWARKPA